MRLRGWKEYRDSLGVPHVRLRILNPIEWAEAKLEMRRRFVRRVVFVCGFVLFVVGSVLLARRGWR